MGKKGGAIANATVTAQVAAAKTYWRSGMSKKADSV